MRWNIERTKRGLSWNMLDMPDAVIEILSKGYEKKDTEVSLPFYLEQGIADIILIDPATNRVSHCRDSKRDLADVPLSPRSKERQVITGGKKYNRSR